MTTLLSRGSFLLSVLTTMLTSSLPAAAQNAPAPPPLLPIDLGQTNILDGEGKPGGLLEVIGFGYLANRLTSSSADDLAGRNRQRIGSLILHPVFVSEFELAGAHPGFEALAPLSYIENDFSGGPSNDRFGIGDVTFAPFLQWSPQNPGPGSMSARIALQIVAPLGSFDSARPVNTGQGGWQISPYVATTWRVSDQWEISGRAIYDWSGSQSHRLVEDGPSIKTRPGDLAALNFSTSYEVSPDWRIGVGGYLLQQLHDATIDGEKIADHRERVLALGPVMRWQQNDVTILAAAYSEFAAKNRPEGFSFNLRLQYPF